MAYNRPSTIQRVSDQVLGLHVETSVGALPVGSFAGVGNVETDMFTVYGRIQITQLFVEFTAAGDGAAATQLLFYYNGSEPALTLVALCGAGTAVTSVAIGQRCMHVGGAVASTPIITDSAGLTDVELASAYQIVGGYATGGATGIFTGTIGMRATVADQGGTIAATGHIFYVPLSPDAAVEAAI